MSSITNILPIGKIFWRDNRIIFRILTLPLTLLNGGYTSVGDVVGGYVEGAVVYASVGGGVVG